MNPTDQKKTSWALIWIVSVVCTPLLQSFPKQFLICFIALVSINIFATFKLIRLAKSEEREIPMVKKIFVTLWIIILSLMLMLLLAFIGRALIPWALDVYLG